MLVVFIDNIKGQLIAAHCLSVFQLRLIFWQHPRHFSSNGFPNGCFNQISYCVLAIILTEYKCLVTEFLHDFL